MAAVAYLTIIGAVIAAINNSEKKNPFTAFHVRQGLGLWSYIYDNGVLYRVL